MTRRLVGMISAEGKTAEQLVDAVMEAVGPQTEQKRAEAALVKLAGLPGGSRIQAPWPLAPYFGLSQAVNDGAFGDAVWVEKQVRIDSLFSGYGFLIRSEVADAIEYPHGVARVVQVNKGGTVQNVIVDGFHRLAAEWLRGAEEVTVLALEAPHGHRDLRSDSEQGPPV